MKLTLFAIALLCGLSVAAPASTPAKAFNLSVQQASDLLAGLRALDGYDRVVKDGAREHIVKEPYRLGAGLRLAIAKNLVKLGEVVGAASVAHNAKLMELSAGTGTIQPNSEAANQLAAEDNKMMLVKQNIDLVTIGIPELALEGPNSNPIPASVLALLMPILEE